MIEIMMVVAIEDINPEEVAAMVVEVEEDVEDIMSLKNNRCMCLKTLELNRNYTLKTVIWRITCIWQCKKI